MRQSIYSKISAGLVFLTIIMLVILSAPTWANDDCRGNQPCTTATLSGGDNTATNSAVISGSRSYGFAHSLGDVDINQCLASTQWGTILVSKQKVVLNLWCAGEVFDAKGLPQMAAIMRCDIPEIKRHFTTPAECIAANTAVFHVEPLVTESRDDEEDERIEALYARMAAHEDMEARQVSAAEKAADRAIAAAKRADRAETNRKQEAERAYLNYQEQFIEQD